MDFQVQGYQALAKNEQQCVHIVPNVQMNTLFTCVLPGVPHVPILCQYVDKALSSRRARDAKITNDRGSNDMEATRDCIDVLHPFHWWWPEEHKIVAAKGNLDPRARNPGLREKYLLALHSKLRQAGSPELEVAPSGREANREARREVVSYAQALRGTRGKTLLINCL
jgi:hypothetical protein